MVQEHGEVSLVPLLVVVRAEAVESLFDLSGLRTLKLFKSIFRSWLSIAEVTTTLLDKGEEEREARKMTSIIMLSLPTLSTKRGVAQLCTCTCRLPSPPLRLPRQTRRAFSLSSPSLADPVSPFSYWGLVPHSPNPTSPPEPPVPPHTSSASGVPAKTSDSRADTSEKLVDEGKKKKKKSGTGLFSMFTKGKLREVEETEGQRWSSEATRALERTLRGAKGSAATGAVGGMNMRCTTLNEKGELLYMLKTRIGF